MTLLLKHVFCSIAVAGISLGVYAADSAGMLYAKGSVIVDGNPVKDSTAVLPGNLIETKADSEANLTVAGSTVTLRPETLVKFAGADIYLDHGAVNVGTSTQLRVHVKCVQAQPASTTWSQFDVADVQGTLQIVARKGGIGISFGSEFNLAKADAVTQNAASTKPPVALNEGQQFNRYEGEGCPVDAKHKGVAAASAGIQHNPVAQAIALAGGIGAAVYFIPHGSQSISPTAP